MTYLLRGVNSLMGVKDLPRGAGDICLYKGLTGKRAQSTALSA